MFVSIVLLSLVAQSVSFGTHKVTTVRAVLDQLSMEAGLKITIPAPLGKNLIFIDRNGASPDKAVHCIAEALHATVRGSGATLAIERTKADVDQAQESRTKERVTWVRKKLRAVDEYRTNHRVNPDEVFAEITKQGIVIDGLSAGLTLTPVTDYATELLPSQKLLQDLMRLVGERKIAETASGSVRVWEDSPVDGTEFLPTHERALNECLNQYARLNQPPLPANVKRQLARLGMAEFFPNWGEGQVRPTKLRLVERAEDGQNNVLLFGFDQAGKQVLFSAESISPRDFIRFPSLLADEYLRDLKTHRVEVPEREQRAAQFRRITQAEGLPDWFRSPE